DLLLPEGFPYHDGSTNAELETRMSELLAIYGATPASWLNFTLHRHVWDQWSWAVSRVLSARHGYMYYLMHNEVVIDGDAAKPTMRTRPGSTTLTYAQERLNNHANFERGRDAAHLAGIRG